MSDTATPSAPILLDHNATTPVHDAVVDAMLPYLRTHFGNPSSGHAYGAAPKKALAEARAQVAELIGAHPEEVVFVSGGSEADNWALKGSIDAREAEQRSHIVYSAIEHPAVSAPATYLAARGRATCTVVPVGKDGRVDAEVMAEALRPDTAVCSLMHANNESGVIQPVAAVGEAARGRGVWMHTDAAQSIGKIPVSVDALRVDLLTLAGHKLYAPKGIGALFIKRGIQLEPLLHGGGQESGRRAGTENIPYAVGLGVACTLAAKRVERRGEVAALRDALADRLATRLNARLHFTGGRDVPRLPNTLSICVEGVVGSDVLAACPQLAASTGSACHEGEIRLSPVLAAMGVSPAVGQGALRLSLGAHTTAAEVEAAADALLAALER